METYQTVIVGGGMVAGYAAKQLVKEEQLKRGTLLILSEDSEAPYERPPLSKKFLAGTKELSKVFINPEGFYEANGIDLRLNVSAKHIDPANSTLITSFDEEIAFQRLVLATGSRVRHLGIEGDNLSGVHYLRTLHDSMSIRAAADQAKRAVVIGGGFIAMEVAAVLNQKGLQTTLVYPSNRIWKRVFTPEMSEFFENYYRQKGVTLVKEEKGARFSGDGRVESVILESGRELAAELVVVGVGVDPAVSLAEEAGIPVDNGILVNEFLETGVNAIYAAGDVANYYDVLFQKRRRIEHWDNAVSQARHVAHILGGKREPFVHVPYFFSDEFDLSYEFWGDTEGADQVIYRGKVEEGAFSVWWLREGCVRAAFVLNRPDEERELAPKWIEACKRVDRLQLENEGMALSEAGTGVFS